MASAIDVAPLGTSLLEGSIQRPAAVQLAFRGQIVDARAAFAHLSALADERGEAVSAAVFHVQRCELELRAGEAVQAARLLDEWEHWAASDPRGEVVRHRLAAILGAIQGLPQAAEREAAATFDRIGADPAHHWDALEARRALGIARLFARDWDRAVSSLNEIWAHTVREGVDDPGAFPVAADLVEALVESGDIGAAREVVERLGRLAVEQGHPWGLPTVARCGAVIQLAERYADDAAVTLAEAATSYGELGLGFDQARSLMFLGRAQRRSKKRGDARRSLEQAAAIFARLGCDGWAAQAASELARVSGRRPAEEGQLTPSELRVAQLAASGLSNKEIASQLFVSVYTVEGHLKHAYAKLGVRSRSQLAAALDSA
jgi:DNA-binding CsgD family transcriptional regulator